MADFWHRCSSRQHRALGKQLPLQFHLVTPAVQKLHTSSLTNVVENMLKQAGFSFTEQPIMSISWETAGLSGAVRCHRRQRQVLHYSKWGSKVKPTPRQMFISSNWRWQPCTFWYAGVLQPQPEEQTICPSFPFHSFQCFSRSERHGRSSAILSDVWMKWGASDSTRVGRWLTHRRVSRPLSGVHRNPSYCACYNYSSQRSRPLIKHS